MLSRAGSCNWRIGLLDGWALATWNNDKMPALPLHDGCLQIFDVDHGQCALLTMPAYGQTYRVLIDCGHAVNPGARPWYPGELLQQMGVRYIDLLVCTNYDEDHASGYPDLQARGISVGCILGNPSVRPDTIAKLKAQRGMGPGITALARDLSIRRDMAWAQTVPTIPNVRMVWASNSYPHFQDENNLSLVLTLDVFGWRFLFPGDMEDRGWAHLLAHTPLFREQVPGVHVLIASHHGRDNGIHPELFSVHGCCPDLIVISDDYKQYATQETTSYYGKQARGITGFRDDPGVRKVLTTRCDGPITFSFQNGRCRVL